MSPLTAYVVETLVTLLGVVALAVLVLYGARRLGVGRPGGPIDLVGRLPLDGRRAVYLVRVGETVYVLGASEAGLSKLGEHPQQHLDLADPTRAGASFHETLQRVLGRSPAPTAGVPGPEASGDAASGSGASGSAASGDPASADARSGGAASSPASSPAPSPHPRDGRG